MQKLTMILFSALALVSLPVVAEASKFGRKVSGDEECRESETRNTLSVCVEIGKDSDGLPICVKAKWAHYCEGTKERAARLKKEAKANEGEIDLDK